MSLWPIWFVEKMCGYENLVFERLIHILWLNLSLSFYNVYTTWNGTEFPLPIAILYFPKQKSLGVGPFDFNNIHFWFANIIIDATDVLSLTLENFCTQYEMFILSLLIQCSNRIVVLLVEQITEILNQ